MSVETSLDDIVPVLPDEGRRAKELDRLITLSHDPGELEPHPGGSWEVVLGSGPVFSAPHEAAHVRDGVAKVAEKGTGSLVLALARHTGGSAIVTTDRQLGDPSWDLDHPYVGRAFDIAGSAIFVDVHMMRPRGVELCLGLGPIPHLSANLWGVFADEAVAAGLRVSVNWPFAAVQPRTVVGQLQRRGLRAIQLELSWDCFDASHRAMARAWSSLARASSRLCGVDHRIDGPISPRAR